MEAKSKRDEIIEIVNKLFIYTDNRQWKNLTSEVFKENVNFDMTSMGAGDATQMKATEICKMWQDGFEGIDIIHHQAGNFLIKLKDEDTAAEVFCYALASHYKGAAREGKTREFVGSYDIHLVLTDYGWRIDSFKYNLKYATGNTSLT
jgi:hypothetical protein